MKSSYLIKAENCLKSAKILCSNGLYENATSEAYYSMYNSVLSLLFKTGIKSENHSASILLLEMLFKKKELAAVISWAKDERIDKQYYVESQQAVKATEQSCSEMISSTEGFLVSMKLFLQELSIEGITAARNSFEDL